VLGALSWAGSAASPACRVEMLARAASANELSFAFRFVFLACALVLAFGMAFLIGWRSGAEGPTAPARRSRRRK